MKSRNKYPWGVENPIERERRLKSQIAREAEGSAKRLRWEKEMAALENWRAENPDGQRTAPAEPEATDKRWVPHLRERWCAACNAVLEKEEHPKRYHPGGYKDLGIDAEPTKHLGNKASALEAQGHITAAGPANTETALRNMMADSEARNGARPGRRKRRAGRPTRAGRSASTIGKDKPRTRRAAWNGCSPKGPAKTSP